MSNRDEDVGGKLGQTGNSWLFGMFMHSDLDDSELTPVEHRVYGHLCRRANDEQRAWGSQRNIAANCRISVDTVGRALKVLEARRFIRREAEYRKDGSRTTDTIIMLGISGADLGAKPLPQKHPHHPANTPPPPPVEPRAEGNPLEVNPLKEIIITPSLSASLQDADAAHEISKNFLKEEVEEVIAEEKQELQETQGGEKGRKVWSSKVAGIVKSKQRAAFAAELSKLLKPSGVVNVLTLVNVLAGNEEKILAGLKRKPAIALSLCAVTPDQLSGIIKESKLLAASYPSGWQSTAWVQALDILGGIRVSDGAAEWPSSKTRSPSSIAEKLGPNSTPDPRFFYNNGAEWRRYSPTILAQRLMEHAALNGVLPYSIALEYLKAGAVNQEFVDDFKPREE